MLTTTNDNNTIGNQKEKKIDHLSDNKNTYS